MNNFSNYGGSSFGTATQSQYQGLQKQYQPAGYVQSFYGQNTSQGNQQPYSQQAISSQQYHTSNYRGNQPGHDSYKHSDSSTPSQQQTNASFQGGYSSFSNQSNVSGQYGISQSPYASRSTSQYGNLSNQFANQSYQQYASQPYSGQASRSQNQNQQFSQAVSPQSFHLANYRGNQPGHDSYKHSDSSTPSQQQFGQSIQGGYSSQNQGFSSGINNVSQQFGFNNAY